MLGAAGCSSGSATSTSATVAVTSPEQHQADQATVAAGLGKMVATAVAVSGSVAAGTTVDDAGARLEADWALVEGTVKTNAADTYIAIEDAIATLDSAGKSGDTAGAAKGSAGLSTAVTAYLAKFP